MVTAGLHRVLIVSDQRISGSLDAMYARGFETTLTRQFDTATANDCAAQYDLIVVDLARARDGFIAELRQCPELQRLPILVVGEWGTGQPSLALSQGADGFEPVPIDLYRLADSIERLLNSRGVAVPTNH